MHVIPAPDRLIPNPDGPAAARHLPPEGADVPDTAYWRRRLADGDVTIAPDQVAKIGHLKTEAAVEARPAEKKGK